MCTLRVTHNGSDQPPHLPRNYMLLVCRCSLACPGFHQSLDRMALLCIGLCIYFKSHTQKFRSFRGIFQVGPSSFVYTKEFQKNTKENIPSKTFCSHLSQDGQINLIPSPDYYICIALSIDTHIDQHRSHIAIWPYGHMAKIWSYGHMTIC
jgi:hypothetical protein